MRQGGPKRHIGTGIARQAVQRDRRRASPQPGLGEQACGGGYREDGGERDHKVMARPCPVTSGSRDRAD